MKDLPRRFKNNFREGEACCSASVSAWLSEHSLCLRKSAVPAWSLCQAQPLGLHSA